MGSECYGYEQSHCFLVQGCVVESGTHSSLLAKSGKYATMWSRQANVDDASSIELFEDNQHIKHE